MDMLIGFLLAFLIGGALCAAFQAFMMLTKLRPPEILIIGFSLGAVLLPLGAIAVLEAYGGAGMAIMVMDAGAGTSGALAAFFQGNQVPLVTVLGVFISLTIIGIVAGMIRSAAVSKSETAESGSKKVGEQPL